MVLCAFAHPALLSRPVPPSRELGALLVEQFSDRNIFI
jgi:hypothetical protein